MSGSSTPHLPTQGPLRTSVSRNSARSERQSRSSTPAPHPSEEDDHFIAGLAHQAALELGIDRACFPTLFSPPTSDDFSEGEKRILPILVVLVERVSSLSKEVAALSSRPPSSPEIIPPPPVTDPSSTAVLRDLSSQVSSLSSRPPPPPSLPPPPPPVAAKPSTAPSAKRPTLSTSVAPRIVPSVDFPIQVSGQWYGNPEAYARAHNDSHEADVYFASVDPRGGEASKVPKKDRFPTPFADHFLPGPPPGFTVSPVAAPGGSSWAKVASAGKKAGKRATAGQVASASANKGQEGPSAPPTLPAAQRRFYAPRLSPAAFENPLLMSTALPDTMASVLKEASCTLPLALAASVNTNGAVTLTAPPHFPAVAYSPFFSALTKKLNQSFADGENPFPEFRTAPLFTDLLIHNLPLSMLPPESANLLDRLRESIQYSTGATIDSARFLQKDRLLREEKLTTSIVMSVTPQDLPLFGPNTRAEASRIRLFNRMRDVHLAHPASRDTQCKNCFRFGHSKPLCKASSPSCPICAKPHLRSQHRCASNSCPGQGNLKAVVDCCAATRPVCVNCDGEHPATSPACPIRVAICESFKSARDTAIPDAPSTPTPLPVAPSDGPPPAPATARQVPPRDPARPVPFSGFAGPSRPPLAAPMPARALFSTSSGIACRAEDSQDGEEDDTL